VNPKPIDTKRRPTPVIHVISRGARYAFRSITLIMCTNAMKIMRFAPQEWMERISQPNSTSAMRNCTDSYAPSALGR
jgi:hypothetical protein